MKQRLSIPAALRDGCRVYVKRWREVLLLLLYEFVLRLAALTPLLFLTAADLRPLALLCIPMYALIVLPARQSTADAMQESLAGGPLFGERLRHGRVPYVRRVGHGLKHALWIFLWTAPWILMLSGVGVWLYRLYKPTETVVGTSDVFTVVKSFFDTLREDEPVSLRIVLETVLAMFTGAADNTSVLRVLPQLLALPAAGLFASLMIGMAFHSAGRHEAPYDSAHLRFHSARGRTMLVWLLSVLPVLLCLAVAALCAGVYLMGVIRSLKQLQLSLPPMPLLPALGIVVSLLLAVVLQPLHSLIVGAWVRQVWVRRAAALPIWSATTVPYIRALLSAVRARTSANATRRSAITS